VNDSLQEFSSNEVEELSPSPKKGLNLRSYSRTFRRKALLIAGITSAAMLVALVSSKLDPYTYSGSFYLLVEPITSAGKLSDVSTLTRTGGVPNEELLSLDYPTNLAFLQSPGMTLRIAKKVYREELTKNAPTVWKKSNPVPSIWKDLRENLVVSRMGDTQKTATKIFEVTYSSDNPKIVQLVLDTAAETFINYSTEDKKTSLKAGIEFIDKQLPPLQQRLGQLQLEQQKLRQQHDLIDPVAKGEEIFKQINDLTGQQLDVQSQLSAQKALYALLQKQLKLTPQEALAAASLSQDPSRQALLEKLQDIESQIALESANFTAQSPNLKALEDKRQNLLALLDQKTQKILVQNSIFIAKNSPILTFQDSTRLKLIEQLVDTANQVQMLEVRHQSLTATKKTLEQGSQKLPDIIRRANDIDRQMSLTQQILDRLLIQKETLKVEAAQDLPWQLISKPQIPLDANGKPIGYPPNRKNKLLAGIAGGLLLGMGLAILLEKRRNIFYTVEDIQDVFPKPLLGEIPYGDRFELSPNLITELDLSVLDESSQYSDVGESLFVNAFDSLYTQLYLSYTELPLRSLIVNSVESRDGQSTIAVNLAKTAVAAGKRVLLVDANWRKPQLHHWFNLSNYKGLSHILQHPSAFEEIIQPVPEIENLFVLTTGTSLLHIPQRLWTTQMKSLMETFQAKYDLVIYDLPHFFDSLATAVLAPSTDGILMVVAVGKTRPSIIKKAIDQINTLHLPCLGIVANHLGPAPSQLL
jgi:succinoglycan biosynthesis transport protein ExoP